MDLQQKIRKNQNQMVVSGNMLRFFGAWIFLKLLLYITLNHSQIKDALMKLDSRIANSRFVIAGEIFVLVLAGFLALIYLYVAKCAIDEAKKNKKHKCFLILIILILIVNVIDILMYFNVSLWVSSSDAIVSLFTDIANFIVVVQLIYSTIFFRKHAINLN